MKSKRGRKKGSKNISFNEPHNLGFWKITLERPEEVDSFLTRGSQQQKETIKEILLYLQRVDPDFFDSIDGRKILRKIK